MNDLVNDAQECIRVNTTLQTSRTTVKDQKVHHIQVESLEWNLPLGQIFHKHYNNIFFCHEGFQSKYSKE